MTEVGEITFIHKGEECDVDWKMNFFSLSKNVGEYYWSPNFLFKSEKWHLGICPNGSTSWDSAGFIDLHIVRQSDLGAHMMIDFSFAIKSMNGEKVIQRQGTGVYRCDIFRFVSKSYFKKRQSEFLSSGSLTIVCTLKRRLPTGNASTSTDEKCFCCKEVLDTEFIPLHKKCVERPIKCPDCSDVVLLKDWLYGHKCQRERLKECSYCRKNIDAESISTHEKKCMDRPIKCPECSKIFMLHKWLDHECQASGAEDDRSLNEDFKKVLLNGLTHDLILKVGDKELRAHQDILRARSKVFESMLSHDTKEKKSGVIDISDCDSQAMEQFLSYTYTGKVDTLDESNMLQLYYIADKYDMKGLKEECHSFIKTAISCTNFCEIIQLALNHSDSTLLEHATEYFIDNMLAIMCTVKWQNFLKDNTTVANELTIKSVKKLKNSNI